MKKTLLLITSLFAASLAQANYLDISFAYAIDSDADMYFGRYGIPLVEEANMSHNVEIETGYLYTRTDTFSLEIERDTIPLFVNYRYIQELSSGVFFTGGAGLGLGWVETDSFTRGSGGGPVVADSNDNFVPGGQIFATIGHHFNESISVFLGTRWILFGDNAKPFVGEDDGSIDENNDEITIEFGVKFRH